MSTIVSRAQGYLPAVGVRLGRCDIVRTGPQALIQVESEGEGKVLLGPDSRFLFDLPLPGAPAVVSHSLVSGWAKITVPKREPAAAHRIATPHFAVLIDAGTVVLRAAADGGQFFVEEGSAVALITAGNTPSRVAVGAGRSFSRLVDQGKNVVAVGVDPAFAAAMPPSLRDTLPSLLGQLKARNVPPKPAQDFSPVDAAELQKSVPELRPCFVDNSIRDAQAALKRRGFDVGPIDGVFGPRTQAALREFQSERGLSRSGELDAQTLKALDVSDPR